MALSFEDDINPLVSLYLNDQEVRWNKATRVVFLNDGVKKVYAIDSQDEFNMQLASSWEQTFRRGMRSDG